LFGLVVKMVSILLKEISSLFADTFLSVSTDDLLFQPFFVYFDDKKGLSVTESYPACVIRAISSGPTKTPFRRRMDAVPRCTSADV